MFDRLKAAVVGLSGPEAQEYAQLANEADQNGTHGLSAPRRAKLQEYESNHRPAVLREAQRRF